MARVALIPTGVLEHAALATALAGLFPDDEFVTLPPEKPLDSFTSRDVTPLVNATPGPVVTNLDELAAELVNAVMPGRRRQRMDFAYVVEDLELVNRNHPDLVLCVFRDAVSSYINRTWPQQSDPKFAAVRERCSFQLFCPMTEAYFFGDEAALRRAGTVQPPQLPPDVDLEQFRTVDAAFLSLPPQTRRIADMPLRELHPKSYLQYLCDPTLADRARRYREGKNGVKALESLDWAQVVGPAPHCPFLHAFLDDLAAALDSPLPFLDATHAEPRVRFPGPRHPILRNL
jgi:hypothetical protein